MKQVLFILALTMIAMVSAKSLIKQNVCSLPSETGQCRALISRFFFNSQTGNCETFNYGGCGGNANNFSSLAECQNKCVCSLPKNPGNCRALIPRFFFNSQTGNCEQFNYGGCGGNANNFSSLAECQNSCISS
jgi:hypothetical protein